MKKITAGLLIIILMLGTLSAPFAVAEMEPVPEHKAQNVIMVNRNTGAVVYEQAADEKIYPASTTKIMTITLAAEMLKDMDESVTVSETFNDDLIPGSSGIALKPGEILSVRDLFYATAIASANDASNVLAERAAGSREEFIKLMNKKAKELGCKGTNFANTHGLPDEDHYTTARDMMLIMRYALKNDWFRKLASTYAYTIEATNKSERRAMSTTNSLISSVSAGYYRYACGGKTGTTTAAGYNLISWASKGDMDFILVAMHAEKTPGSSNPIFKDSKALYTWAFDNFSYQKIVDPDTPQIEIPVKLSAEKDFVVLCAKESLSAILPNETDLSTLTYKKDVPEEILAPITKGDVYGTLTIEKDGIVYGKTDLVANADVSRSAVLYYLYCIRKFFENLWVRIIGSILLVLLIIYIILMIRNNRRRRKLPRFKSRLKY